MRDFDEHTTIEEYVEFFEQLDMSPERTLRALCELADVERDWAKDLVARFGLSAQDTFPEEWLA